MDNVVVLVQADLRVDGHFAVAEPGFPLTLEKGLRGLDGFDVDRWMKPSRTRGLPHLSRDPMSNTSAFARLDDPFLAQLTAHLARTARTEDERRVARIAAEAMHAFRELAHVRKAVAIFGSARIEAAGRWGGLAMETAELLARDGFAVITGGGPGLMEAANAGAHRGGGGSIGLTIHLPLLDEPLNPHVLVPVPFHYFFLRKLAFVKYSCAFVCLPGGYGTLDELFEALNLRRTHRLESFPVILVGSAYWNGLLDWLLEVAVPEGTLMPEDLELIEVLDDPEAVARRVRASHAELCRTLGIVEDAPG